MKQNYIEGGTAIMNNNIEHDHSQETQKLWDKSEQLPFVKGLKEGKSVAEIMEQLDYKKAFKGASEELGCSDGRICEHRRGLAGNYILASKEEQDKFVEENKGKIKVVKSHSGCGAAGIKFKQMQEAGEPMPEGVTTADELGIYFSKELAERLGADYAHTSSSEMSGAVHNERAIYFDGTGKFNPSALTELPAGFMCSSAALGANKEYSQNEMAVLAGIAFGDHGFGERFNKDNPLYVMVTANSQKQLDELKEISEKMARQFANGKIKVDGFVIE